jgi:hypothetical protein
VAYKNIVGCNIVNKLIIIIIIIRGLGMYLYRVRCMWEKEISNHGERMEDDGA